MARKVKVYGGTFMLSGGKQFRGVMAGTKREISEATGHGMSHINGYWSETGNRTELEIALAEPGVLFYCPLSSMGKRSGYKRVEKENTDNG